jgi:hypothetical protein
MGSSRCEREATDMEERIDVERIDDCGSNVEEREEEERC